MVSFVVNDEYAFAFWHTAKQTRNYRSVAFFVSLLNHTLATTVNEFAIKRT